MRDSAYRIRWLTHRAKALSAPELAYRVRRFLEPRARRVAGALGLAPEQAPPSPDGYAFLRGSGPQLFPLPLECSGEVERQLLAAGVPVYGRWVPWRDDPGFWHTDPLCGVRWPRRPTSAIDYRPGNRTGDVRIVWELNRLQHLLPLAHLAVRDEDVRQEAVSLIVSQLGSWLDANPSEVGVNQASAMEQALRIVAVAHAFDAARAYLPTAAAAVVGDLVLGHARAIEGHLSLYSSAGNHTIAEAVGLLYAGLLFHEHPRAARWVRIARDLLKTESRRQVNRDGGGLEQAVWYLLFVADLLGLAQALLRHLTRPRLQEVDDAVARARDCLQSLGSGPEDLPSIGDGDGGYALSPHLRLSWGGRRPTVVRRTFPDTGLTVVSRSDEERFVFLHNGLGMAPFCGHGHADCLSVLLRHGGQELLIDPGTYQYGGFASFRRYFRSSFAHNTLSVSGLDQAEQVACFVWKGAYRCDLLRNVAEDGQYLMVARHDAYRRAGITAWRGIAYAPGRFLVVGDAIQGMSKRALLVRWHFGCAVRLSQAEDEVTLMPARRDPLKMTLPRGRAVLLEGSVEPLAGWKSTRYGAREPCPVLEVRPKLCHGAIAMTTLLLSSGPRLTREVERATARLGTLIAAARG